MFPDVMLCRYREPIRQNESQENRFDDNPARASEIDKTFHHAIGGICFPTPEDGHQVGLVAKSEGKITVSFITTALQASLFASPSETGIKLNRLENSDNV